MLSLPRPRGRRLALALALPAVALAGTAYAAIPSADGTISACLNSKGALKVIDAAAGASCPDGQKLLAWNQQGPPGISGYEVINAQKHIAPGTTGNVSAVCSAGKKPIGGGALVNASFDAEDLVGSRPVVNYPGLPPAWQGIARNDSQWEMLLQVNAICAYVR